MSHEPGSEVDSIRFRKVFPCLHLARAFRIAVDVRKLLLAGIALLLLAGGNKQFDRLTFAPPPAAELGLMSVGESVPGAAADAGSPVVAQPEISQPEISQPGTPQPEPVPPEVFVPEVGQSEIMLPDQGGEVIDQAIDPATGLPVVNNPEPAPHHVHIRTLFPRFEYRWPWDETPTTWGYTSSGLGADSGGLPFGADMTGGRDASFSPLAQTTSALRDPIGFLGRIATNWRLVLRPMEGMLEPALSLLQPRVSWSQLAFDATRLLWTMLVWALFGGAIGRLAAVQFARDEQVSLWSALKFSAGRFLGYISAPLLPMVGLAVLWGLTLLGGVLGRIPYAGDYIVAVLWGLGLLLGFLMALVLLGLAAGWPLMTATINVEGTDGFDGLSRSYNYVYERPWHYLGYLLFALIHGSITMFFVWGIGELIVLMTAWGVSWGLGLDHTAQLLLDNPLLLGGKGVLTGNEPLVGTASRWAPEIAGFWLRLLAMLVVGYTASYFWTSTTIMYFLLRRVVDGNELDEVAFDEAETPDPLLPLVGMAAMAPASGATGPAAAPASTTPVAPEQAASTTSTPTPDPKPAADITTTPEPPPVDLTP